MFLRKYELMFELNNVEPVCILQQQQPADSIIQINVYLWLQIKMYNFSFSFFFLGGYTWFFSLLLIYNLINPANVSCENVYVSLISWIWFFLLSKLKNLALIQYGQGRFSTTPMTRYLEVKCRNAIWGCIYGNLKPVPRVRSAKERAPSRRQEYKNLT